MVKNDKYQDEFPELVKLYIIEYGLVNGKGQPAWKKIAKILGVTNKTILLWREPMGKYYKPKFAEACREAEEATHQDKIKRSLIQRAEGYVRKIITKVEGTNDKGTYDEKKVTKEKILGDVQAAKIVLANLGPKEKRWYDKQQVGFAPDEKLEININFEQLNGSDKQDRHEHSTEPKADDSISNA